MAIVNFVKENIAFIEYASDNGLSGNERLLWYALFHIVNMRAQGTNWPDGFISVGNKRLLSFLPYSEDSLVKARLRLAQRGIIKYEAGKKNTATPMYALVYFTACYTDLECYPQNTGNNYGNTWGNMQGNMGGNVGGNVQGNMGGNMTGIIYKHKQGVNDTDVNGYDDDDNDDEEAFAHATREEVISAFRSNFGRAATIAEADRLSNIALRLGVSQFVGRAVQKAALNGANNPLRYAVAVLQEWNGENLETEAELDEYQYLRDCADGRTVGDAEDARKKIR